MYRLIVTSLFVLALVATAVAADGMVCPVTGRPAKAEFSLQHDGATYHFSSRGAMRLFQLRPEKYAKTNDQIAQKLCPVMGGAIDETIFVDHDGRRVYFCCAGCIPKFEADPKKYLAIIDARLAAQKKVTPKATGCPSGCTSHGEKPKKVTSCASGCTSHGATPSGKALGSSCGAAGSCPSKAKGCASGCTSH